MNQCIFCKSTSVTFTTLEHILPESLGGSNWALLPAGLFCDSCQNRFGSRVEKQALADYPFSLLRVFIGIPTKKGRAPWLESWEGRISASLQPGTVGYDPAPVFQKAFVSGNKTQIRLLAHPSRPDMVCRFLLKMGIEVIAQNNPQYALATKFDIARQFALEGKKPGKWWYIQVERIKMASRFIIQGVSLSEWSENVKLEVLNLSEEQEIFHLSLLYLDMFVPLTNLIMPQLEGLEEPEYRLFWV